MFIYQSWSKEPLVTVSVHCAFWNTNIVHCPAQHPYCVTEMADTLPVVLVNGFSFFSQIIALLL